MTYIEGFVIPVPTAKKAEFVAHARKFDEWIIEQGALRVVEGWGVDVPRGKLTDFYGGVQATEDETVAFSWIEWPDKAVRDAGHARMREMMAGDGFAATMPEMPFDGKRMIYGGFEPVIDVGETR
jgi:uncharacterized protein YbaA (DUF1428 family)